MKKLKLLFLTLLSVLSFNLFSQVQVYTTATSGPNVCDGTAMLDTMNILPTSIFWQGMGAVINQGSYYVTNLCPGTYMVTFSFNGNPVTQTFTITAGCAGFGITTTSANSTSATNCDGTIIVNVNGGTAPFTYIWGNGTPVTSNMSTNLCPGNYVIEVIDANLCSDITNVDILDSTQMVGDTLIINAANMCNNPIGTLSSTLEDCNLDYNSIDSAFLSSITIPTNPLDSVMVTWMLVDTNGVNLPYQVYTTIPSTGCYNFQLIVYCLQKSMDYKTIVANATWYMDNVGIKELTGNNKQLVSVTDLLGRETKIQPNKVLIYTYSDGSREIKYINE